MALPHSHTQTPQYRYRPNAPVRSISSVSSCSNQSSRCQTPLSVRRDKSQLVDFSSYRPGAESLYLQPCMKNTSNAASSYEATFPTSFRPIEQPVFGFSHGFKPGDFPPQPSPLTSPWISSDSSATSDACSGAWPSPSSEMCFSPDLQHQMSQMESSSWSTSKFNPYFAGLGINTSEYFPAMDFELNQSPVFQPQVSSQCQGHFVDDQSIPVYTSTECSSSHGSPALGSSQMNGSNETVVTIKSRSDSMITDFSFPSLPNGPVKTERPALTSASSSPLPGSKSQFQGHLLEFSTSVAQIRSKGTKSAALPCPLAAYNCTSSFVSKNEWKRHINTQHLRLEAWLCDQCPKRDNKREFNRKDLFIQHLKRMHPAPSPAPPAKAPLSKSASSRSSKSDKAGKTNKVDDLNPALIEAEKRCHITLRQPPTDSSCLFCSTNFSGRGSWEARIEHVAKHMEQFKKEGKDVPDPQSWRSDHALEQWLISEGVVSKVRHRWSVV